MTAGMSRFVLSSIAAVGLGLAMCWIASPEDMGPVLALLLATVVVVHAAVAFLRRMVREHVAHLGRELQAHASLLHALDPIRPLPQLGGHALSAHRALLLHNLFLEHRPGTIVEFGSGTSTLFAAYFVRSAGSGRVVSFEHDAGYAELTRKLLARHGLEGFAQVVHAPLSEVSVGGETWRWYRVDPAMLPEQVDFLFVDGPPRKTCKLARYPAVPALASRMVKGTVVLLDDAARKDEQEIGRRWLKSMPRLRSLPIGGESNMLAFVVD